MGITNIYHPAVQEAARDSAAQQARNASQNTDVVEYLQLMNEWLLRTYIIGWRTNLGLATLTFPAVLVSYDEHARRGWHEFLQKLPEVWRGKVLAENKVAAIADVPMLKDYTPFETQNFSPTYLAWCKFRSYSLGRYFDLMYQAAKAAAPEVKIASHACMPHIVGAIGIGRSDLGHDVEWWLEAGPGCDYLCVNTYQAYWGIKERPYLQDADLEFQLYYTAFSEVVRTYGLKGMMVSETGGSSYCSSEDGHRYILARSIIQVTAYGQCDVVTEFCFDDDVQRTPIHEQFFGIVREKWRTPKPAFFTYELARDISNATAPFADEPFIYLVLSRMAMDMGKSPSAVASTDPEADRQARQSVFGADSAAVRPYAVDMSDLYFPPLPSILAAREVNWKVTTDHMLERGTPASAARAAILAHSAYIATAAFMRRLKDLPLTVVPATIGLEGVDDDTERSVVRRELLGLRDVRLVRRACLDLAFTGEWAGLTSRHRLPWNGLIAEIEENELPPEAHVLHALPMERWPSIVWAIVSCWPLAWTRRGLSGWYPLSWSWPRLWPRKWELCAVCVRGYPTLVCWFTRWATWSPSSIARWMLLWPT